MATLKSIITPKPSPFDKPKQSVDINKILQPKPTPLTPYLPKPKTYGGGGGSSGVRLNTATGVVENIPESNANQIAQQNFQNQQLAQQNLIRAGQQAQASRWELVNGRSVLVPYTALKRNIGESEASFKWRSKQLGKAISQEQPEAYKQYIESEKQAEEQKGETIIYQNPDTREIRVKTPDGKDRLATKEEAEYLMSQTGEVQAKVKPKFNIYPQEGETKPIGKVEGKIREDIEGVLIKAKKLPVVEKTIELGGRMIKGGEVEGYKFDMVSGQYVPIEEYQARQVSGEKSLKKVEGAIDIVLKNDPDFVRGAVKGIVTYPIREPERTQVLLATAPIIPKGFKAAERASVLFFGGSKALGKGAISLVGAGMGTAYALDVGTRVIAEPTIEGKGKVIGESIFEIGVLAGVSKKPSFKLKKTMPELNYELVKKDYKSLAEIYKKQEGAVVFDTKIDKGKIGRDLLTIKQAKANLPQTPFEFEIKPTIEQQRQIVRLQKGLDIVEVGKGYAKVRLAEKPEVLKTLYPKEVTFDISSKELRNIEFKKKQQQLRFKEELDILEATKEGFVIREAPKPEVLKVFNEPKPFEFEVRPTIEQQRQIVRLQKGLDIVEVGKGYAKVRLAEKPEVLKELNEIKIVDMLEPPKRVKRQPFTFEEIEQEPVGKQITSGRQQLVQVMKEPTTKKVSYVKPRSVLLSAQKSLEREGLVLKTKQELISKPKTRGLISLQKDEQLLNQATKEVQMFKQPQRQILLQKLIQEEGLAQPSAQASRQLFKQPQAFAQPQRFGYAQPQRQVQKYRFREPEMLKEDYLLIRKKKRLLLPPGKKEAERDLGFGELGFDLGIVIKGKEKIIARGLTELSAKNLGTKRILQDLRATFYLKPSKLSGRDLDIPNYYQRYKGKLRRPTKKSRYRKLSPLTFIQKASGMSGRLFSKGELREISLSKRKKRKKLRLLD